MNTYEKRRAWSDPFLPEVKELLGKFLIKNADFKTDCEEATDLIVKPASISVRGRKYDSYLKYPNDITFRLDCAKGICEWDKVINKEYVDLMFYFFADPTDKKIQAYRIIDLHNFAYQWYNEKENVKFEDMTNKDGTRLRCVDSTTLKKDSVILCDRRK